MDGVSASRGPVQDCFGNWLKWWALSIITFGVYLFWVVPRLTRWTVEHQDFA